MYPEKTFTFYWLDGTRETLIGRTMTEAFRSCYSEGALPALDFYCDGDNHDYRWDEHTRKWVKKS